MAPGHHSIRGIQRTIVGGVHEYSTLRGEQRIKVEQVLFASSVPENMFRMIGSNEISLASASIMRDDVETFRADQKEHLEELFRRTFVAVITRSF